MCTACQAMRKTLEELTALGKEDIINNREAKKVYDEMKKCLEDLKSDGLSLK